MADFNDEYLKGDDADDWYSTDDLMLVCYSCIDYAGPGFGRWDCPDCGRPT